MSNLLLSRWRAAHRTRRRTRYGLIALAVIAYGWLAITLWLAVYAAELAAAVTMVALVVGWVIEWILTLGFPGLAALAVAPEKERGTVPDLLLTGLPARHVVVGLLWQRLWQVCAAFAATLPLLLPNMYMLMLFTPLVQSGGAAPGAAAVSWLLLLPALLLRVITLLCVCGAGACAGAGASVLTRSTQSAMAVGLGLYFVTAVARWFVNMVVMFGGMAVMVGGGMLLAHLQGRGGTALAPHVQQQLTQALQPVLPLAVLLPECLAAGAVFLLAAGGWYLVSRDLEQHLLN